MQGCTPALPLVFLTMPITAKSKKGVIEQVMHEGKHGNLHSGKGGPVVKSKRQMVRIALEMSRRKGYK